MASIDPRVNRIDLPTDTGSFGEQPLDQWQTYEVFQQRKRGEHHIHVGAVHGPNPEMALLLAKEQFGRREQCANLWVVKSAEVYATSYEDADMFQHAFDKNYREGDGYKVRYTIEAFQRDLDARLGLEAGLPSQPVSPPPVLATAKDGWETLELPDLGRGPRKILFKSR